MSAAIHPKHLERTIRVLKEATTPLTIKALARRLRCPYSTAKRRLEAVQEDITLEKSWTREGKRGALSVAYSVR